MLGVIMLFPDLMNGQIRWATKDPRAILFNIELKFFIANLVASQIIETLTNYFADIKHQLVAYLNGCNKQFIGQVIPGVKGFENNFLI